MRNLKPIYAVALTLALTSPAWSAGAPPAAASFAQAADQTVAPAAQKTAAASAAPSWSNTYAEGPWIPFTTSAGAQFWFNAHDARTKVVYSNELSSSYYYYSGKKSIPLYKLTPIPGKNRTFSSELTPYQLALDQSGSGAKIASPDNTPAPGAPNQQAFDQSAGMMIAVYPPGAPAPAAAPVAGASPTAAAASGTTPLTAADFEKLSPWARGRFEAAYRKEWAAAGGDVQKQAAVNTKYLQKIAPKTANGTNPTATPGNANSSAAPNSPPLPLDFKHYTKKAQFDSLKPYAGAQETLCAPLKTGGSGGGADACSNNMANASAATQSCASQPIQGGARSACMAQIKTCSAPPSAPAATTPAPAADGPTPEIVAACAMLNQPAATTQDNGTVGEVPPPGMGPGSAMEESAAPAMNHHIADNIVAALPFAAIAAIGASFVFGPVGVLAAALLVGVAAYMLAASYNPPTPQGAKPAAGAPASPPTPTPAPTPPNTNTPST